jgi:hypothetical protein
MASHGGRIGKAPPAAIDRTEAVSQRGGSYLRTEAVNQCDVMANRRSANVGQEIAGPDAGASRCDRPSLLFLHSSSFEIGVKFVLPYVVPS